jgi:hypothetical protein
MPIGTILLWPLADKPPKNWRLCNGQLVTRQEAPEFCDLFKHATWTTEGGNVVHVPDLRGYFICGVDNRSVEDPLRVDEDAPRDVGSIQAEKFPQHSHDVSNLRVAGGLLTQSWRVLLCKAAGNYTPSGDLHELARTLWGGGGEWNTYQLHGGSPEVESIALDGTLGGIIGKEGKLRPDNIALNFIIRVQR